MLACSTYLGAPALKFVRFPASQTKFHSHKRNPVAPWLCASSGARLAQALHNFARTTSSDPHEAQSSTTSMVAEPWNGLQGCAATFRLSSMPALTPRMRKSNANLHLAFSRYEVPSPSNPIRLACNASSLQLFAHRTIGHDSSVIQSVYHTSPEGDLHPVASSLAWIETDLTFLLTIGTKRHKRRFHKPSPIATFLRPVQLFLTCARNKYLLLFPAPFHAINQSQRRAATHAIARRQHGVLWRRVLIRRLRGVHHASHAALRRSLRVDGLKKSLARFFT